MFVFSQGTSSESSSESYYIFDLLDPNIPNFN